MLKSKSINYLPGINKFLKRFNLITKNDHNFDILIIKNTPSFSNGAKLLSELSSKLKVLNKPNLFGVILKINEEINENQDEQPQIYDYNFKERLLISFQSTLGYHESKTYWKIPGCEKFNSFYIDDDQTEDVANFCHEFLINEIKADRTGILRKFQFKNKFRLQEIGDSEERNLLVIATSQIKPSAVKSLLKHDFDADDAIDIAWNLFEENVNNIQKKNKINEIILSLLKANSRFPDDFVYRKASKEVKQFVDMCESLHTDVDEDNFDGLKVKLDSEPNLVHFYDRHNESLLAYSLKNEKFKIMEHLDMHLSTGSHEDLEEIYENMSVPQKRKLREKHKTNAKEYPETYILILRSKSRIGNNDKFSQNKWKYINEALDTLSSNEYCRKIMKVAVKFKNLKIYFDFKHGSTYFMDPATSYHSKGVIYESGSIFIGAKYLTDENKKTEVFGVLAHELCHLAVYIAFMNRNFDPFPTGESALKRRFIDQVMVQCKEREELEKIIANVFISYPENIQDSEMIVTIPQMMMQYVNNRAKIEELERTFEELFKYSREVVEPELDRALVMLEKIENEEKSVKFDKLTEPMKARILHSTIEFQGVETSFFEVIGNDNEILNLLQPKEIKNMLLDNRKIQICKIETSSNESTVKERHFVDSKFYDFLMFPHDLTDEETKKDSYSHQRNQIEKYKHNFQIIQEANDSKIIMIEDHAGMGKTTCFMDLAIRFKQINKNFWVSFVALKSCANFFNDIDKKIENLDIFFKIIKTDSDIETEIFKKLFSEGRVIFLFDGLDEISHKAAQNIGNILEDLMKNENKNRFWISTRPHCSSKSFKNYWWISTYRLAPLNDEEKKNYIKSILKTNNIIEESSQIEIINKIMTHFEDLNEKSTKLSEVDNLLMIQMVTELYIHKSEMFDPENRFEMYQKMIDMQKDKLGDKVPTSERDRDVKFSIWDVHRVLAIKMIFNYKLQYLSIMKRWEKCRQHWTSEMIQRYGFVSVDLDDEDNSINFIHRTFAEFFAAQFFIEIIFVEGIDENAEQDEIKAIAILFCIILVEIKVYGFGKKVDEGDTYPVVKEFLKSFIKRNKSEGIIGIKKFLTTVQCKIPYHFIGEQMNWIVYFANLTNHDSEILDKLWKDDEKNFFKQVLLDEKRNEHISDLATLEKCFGPNWNEIFNKKGEKLVTDDELEALRSNELDDKNWKIEKNLLKLCDLIDKNYEIAERKKMYENFIFAGFSEKVQIEIISKIHSIKPDRIIFFENFMFHFNCQNIHVETQKLIYSCIEEDFNNDSELIRELLFQEFSSHLHNFILENEKRENFVHAKIFFIKHKRNWEDLQKFLLNSDIKYDIFNPIYSSIYHECKLFLAEVFNTNKTILEEQFENCIKTNPEVFGKGIENFIDFIKFVYSNDETKISNILKIVTFRK